MCNNLATEIHGPQATVELVGVWNDGFDAVVNVGREVLPGIPGVSVNSTGGVARLATSDSGVRSLHWSSDCPNPIGALAAACRAVGATFLALLNKQIAISTEMSLASLVRYRLVRLFLVFLSSWTRFLSAVGL